MQLLLCLLQSATALALLGSGRPSALAIGGRPGLSLGVLTRRAVLGAAPAILLAPASAHAIKSTGYAANLEATTDEGAGRRLADTPVGGAAGVRLGGECVASFAALP